MKGKRGAPRKSPDIAKQKLVQFRANIAEKQTFEDAAKLDGKKTSEWIRDRLRRVARKELEAAGQEVAFLVGKASRQNVN